MGEDRPVRRSLACSALAVALVSVLLVGLAASPASAGATAVGAHTRERAEEACEDMVRESVVAAAGQKLSGHQRGVWDDNLFTCSYPLGAKGTLQVRVEVERDRAGARAAFIDAKRSFPRRSTLYGMGQGAFSSGPAIVVARKDQFLLTVDGRGLASSLDRSSVTWSATRAIFQCW